MSWPVYFDNISFRMFFISGWVIFIFHIPRVTIRLLTLIKKVLLIYTIYISNPIVDDRCIVCEPGEEYLGWLITSLSTSCGHFLSLHKTNVKEAEAVFVYLGFEFDCPNVGFVILLKRFFSVLCIHSTLIRYFSYF